MPCQRVIPPPQAQRLQQQHSSRAHTVPSKHAACSTTAQHSRSHAGGLTLHCAAATVAILRVLAQLPAHRLTHWELRTHTELTTHMLTKSSENCAGAVRRRQQRRQHKRDRQGGPARSGAGPRLPDGPTACPAHVVRQLQQPELLVVPQAHIGAVQLGLLDADTLEPRAWHKPAARGRGKEGGRISGGAHSRWRQRRRHGAGACMAGVGRACPCQ